MRDVLVFSRILGKVTAGVGREINHALARGIPVHELSDSTFKRRLKRVRFIDRKATVRLYEKWRCAEHRLDLKSEGAGAAMPTIEVSDEMYRRVGEFTKVVRAVLDDDADTGTFVSVFSSSVA